MHVTLPLTKGHLYDTLLHGIKEQNCLTEKGPLFEGGHCNIELEPPTNTTHI